MANYIIISRVLSPMSDKMGELWDEQAKTRDAEAYHIKEARVMLVNGGKFPLEIKAIFSKILDDSKLNEATDKTPLANWLQGHIEAIEKDDVKEVLPQMETDSATVKKPEKETYIFIHFGGQNDKQVKAPLEKLKSCFDTAKIGVIPFTVNASSSSILEDAGFLDNPDKIGILRTELENRALCYVAREGVFGWLEAYETSILTGDAFEEPDADVGEPSDASNEEDAIQYLKRTKKNEIKKDFETLKKDFVRDTIALNQYNERLKTKLTFKIGVWDAHKQCPIAAKTTDFKQFRIDFANMFDATPIVHPREEDFDAWLIVHTLKGLQKTTNNFFPNENADVRFTRDPLSIKPILSVGLVPLWEAASHPSIVVEDFRKDYLDSRLSFWDSCIWFRYVPLLSEHWGIQQRVAFRNVIDAFDTYKKDGLYDTVSSREFLEFHLRLYHNSFVSGVANHVIRAHGGAVTPFSFHSETKIQQEALKIYDELKGLKWRVLLIDDTSKTALQTVGNAQTLSKQHIIKKAIEADIDTHVATYKPLVKIEPVQKLDTAKKDFIKDKAQHYDIILLDYLFQNDGKNEFSIDFLKDLLKKESEYLKADYLGPLGKHYIVPISVYQNALTDNLHDAALLTHGDKWLITQGTDPLNKPHLFRFILFRLMDRQVKKAFIARDLLEKFNPKKQSEMMDNARRAYLNIIMKSSKLDSLLKFYDTSLFVQSIMENNFKGIARTKTGEIDTKSIVAIGEHFQHLFVLLANGNTQFKPQMWEEYFWLKTRLMVGKEDFWDNIRQYIEHL
jgi:hypothetical protein